MLLDARPSRRALSGGWTEENERTLVVWVRELRSRAEPSKASLLVRDSRRRAVVLKECLSASEGRGKKSIRLKEKIETEMRRREEKEAVGG